MVLLLLFLVVGCAAPRPATTPMPYQFYRVAPENGHALVIFLPGQWDDLGAVERAGFIDALRLSRTPLDAVALDAHLGYYMAGQLAERVYVDVLQPFCQKGYRDFYLVGFSMGGYGAVWLNDAFPGWISGTVLFAPYLGRGGLIRDIKQAGSLTAWRQNLARAPSNDELVWLWLDKLIEENEGELPAFALAVGQDDRLREGVEYLAQYVPEAQTLRMEGAHNWRTWHGLWGRLLQTQEWIDLVYTDPGKQPAVSCSGRNQ